MLDLETHRRRMKAARRLNLTVFWFCVTVIVLGLGGLIVIAIEAAPRIAQEIAAR